MIVLVELIYFVKIAKKNSVFVNISNVTMAYPISE